MNTLVQLLLRPLRAWLLLPVLLLPLSAQAQAAPTPGCDDFLAALTNKPDFIEYQGCRLEMRTHGKPLVARYRVDGAAAALAESYLRRQFGIAPLQYQCCGWQTPPQFWRDPRAGDEYTIGFGSEETLLSSRSQWDQIPSFHIRIERYTEEP
ncbi:DUF4952 domain-containing protein [Achromobacter deleyi]|uniref:DUF4952 domain-containing protein n=1 Tax=Achromobacter deleyi TaxID=1353891 RepID=UPI0014683E94|nr:DUF4952 domain-containing protein [Achromobacter deleyi]CAB3865991.1 hypothetical protein LMG3412_02501 [Achromobacter deleyi]